MPACSLQSLQLCTPILLIKRFVLCWFLVYYRFLFPLISGSFVPLLLSCPSWLFHPVPSRRCIRCTVPCPLQQCAANFSPLAPPQFVGPPTLETLRFFFSASLPPPPFTPPYYLPYPTLNFLLYCTSFLAPTLACCFPVAPYTLPSPFPFTCSFFGIFTSLYIYIQVPKKKKKKTKQLLTQH